MCRVFFWFGIKTHAVSCRRNFKLCRPGKRMLTFSIHCMMSGHLSFALLKSIAFFFVCIYSRPKQSLSIIYDSILNAWALLLLFGLWSRESMFIAVVHRRISYSSREMSTVEWTKKCLEDRYWNCIILAKRLTPGSLSCISDNAQQNSG